ncbi:MAG: alginate lyase family protein [Pseudomonadota bacterium]
MPVRACLLLALLLALPVGAQASAIRSIWSLPAGVARQATAAPDYRTLKCPKDVIEPYTGALLLDSKYDQNDPSKSTLGKGPSKQSEQIHETVNTYGKRLSLFADYYAEAKEPEQAAMALACMDQWLQAWAVAGALESREATKTGLAMRKWTLAAIASSVLKLQALSSQQFQLSDAQRKWLERLANLVLEDYDQRLAPSFVYFNNHDYWAAWAIGATGMLLNNPNYLDWSGKVFRRAMQQITLSASGDYAYLPNELARGKLAANYTHYALVPLILVAETLRINGNRVSPEDSLKLELLANFAVRSVLAPKDLPELRRLRQEQVPAHKMAWLIPFLGAHPQHGLARQLYLAERGEVDGYRQIGGRLKAFYPIVDSHRPR